ncbi:hypothetical protein ALPR1_19243 [Algoriphagus machipongonensis]|uniref:Uncharacterized protein n=1 Tax=Algoriphagus machipongonensis TaxID=388413 RepID=A3HX80_9BACT|nr:hypothetical protein ALPR1_19243 [Algoriphagus machipongonensis]
MSNFETYSKHFLTPCIYFSAPIDFGAFFLPDTAPGNLGDFFASCTLGRKSKIYGSTK